MSGGREKAEDFARFKQYDYKAVRVRACCSFVVPRGLARLMQLSCV